MSCDVFGNLLLGLNFCEEDRKTTVVRVFCGNIRKLRKELPGVILIKVSTGRLRLKGVIFFRYFKGWGFHLFSVFEKAQGLTDGKVEKTFWFGDLFII